MSNACDVDSLVALEDEVEVQVPRCVDNMRDISAELKCFE
jgi:hypothetical protein